MALESNFYITAVNNQHSDGETDVIREEAYGTLSCKNNKYFIMYKTCEDGIENSTLIKVFNDNTIIIKRSGSVSSEMKYIEGEKSTFVYKLPYGDIDMLIDTHEIRTRIDEQGGKIVLKYNLVMQGSSVYNHMIINIRRVK